MENIVIYVHGKGGSAEEAGRYESLFPGSKVVGFDYHARTPWEAREEFPQFFTAQRKRCDTLALVANSIGAFFPCPHWMKCGSTRLILFPLSLTWSS